jgi:hypothetical protein
MWDPAQKAQAGVLDRWVTPSNKKKSEMFTKPTADEETADPSLCYQQ